MFLAAGEHVCCGYIDKKIILLYNLGMQRKKDRTGQDRTGQDRLLSTVLLAKRMT